MAQKSYTFSKEFSEDIQANLNYLLSLPSEYEKNCNKEFPLVLFLHGAGERGSDIELVKRHGPPKMTETVEFPFILLSPQCPLYIPRYSNWIMELSSVMALVSEICSQYRVDDSRIYVTGMSMGGYAAWELGKRFPGKFAAVAPVCGGGSIKNIQRMVDLPVWAFHGAKDDIVLPEESQVMVEALRKAGGNVKYTLYPDANHDSWTETYSNPKFYEWLLSNNKK